MKPVASLTFSHAPAARVMFLSCVRITECLWARTFREAKAGDLGYAMICHGDIASTKAYNPKITLNRPKILMNGDDECRFHWVMGV
jgi:hypothetical protein